jgi:hypothetical protein
MSLILCLVGYLDIHHPEISVQANLRRQVKSQRDGRSQNRRIMRGLPI